MDKTLITLTIVFFLSFVVFTTIVVFNKSVGNVIKAKEDYLPSSKNSIILAWPLTIKADGKSESVISVFVRSQSNKPVTSKVVRLSTTLGTIKEPEMITNKEGVSIFHLVSNKSGTAELSAVVDQTTPIDHKITVKFE